MVNTPGESITVIITELYFKEMKWWSATSNYTETWLTTATNEPFCSSSHKDCRKENLLTPFCLLSVIYFYYLASCMSEQDEPNPELWLATEVGKMVLSWLLLITRCVPQENTVLFPSKRSFIDLFGQDGWVLASFFFCEFMDFNSIVNTPKKDSANIQPSCPHAWSIIHTSKVCTQFCH